ncbi:PAS domain S-box protein [Limnobacter litoralis]|uniref:PAS domain S-box protein n=1 Tax=Limnobacter litoralis TaxID=481366 RepID=A0ABQ5YKY5_9BURK|nr:PAS domain S-box protein [Limnobacter litoralis]GLR25208.1 hypothetical protein GCM10007875_02960 [Limnobacter litoralis]
MNRSAHIKLAGRQDTNRALVVLGALVLLLALGAYSLVRLESSRIQRNQLLAMDQLASEKFESIPSSLNAIDAMRYYIYASKDVSEIEFNQFARFVANYQAVISLDWAPQVTQRNLAAYTRDVRARSFKNYSVYTYRDQAVPADPDEVAYPVYYSVSNHAETTGLGMDHYSDPARRSIMNKAAADDQILIAPIDKARRTQRRALIAVAPVFKSPDYDSAEWPYGQTNSRLRGYVVALLDTDVLLAPIVQAAKAHNFSVAITNLTVPDRPVQLLAAGQFPAAGSGLDKTIQFGGQTWQLQLTSTASAQLVQSSDILVLYRFLSILISLGVVVTVLGGLGRTVSVLRTVQARTIELEERLSQQLLTEAALKQQEENLSVTLQILGEAVIITDEIGNVVKMNPVAESLTGWSQSQSIGERSSAIFCIQGYMSRDSSREPLFPLTEALSHKEIVKDEAPVWIVSRSGSRHLVSYVAAPLLEKSRWLRGGVLVFREVSDVERHHAKVADDERLFRSIVERTPNAIALLNEDTIEFVNPRGLRLLGLNPNGGEQRVIGTKVLQWFAPGDHDALLEFRAQSDEYYQQNELVLTLKRYDEEDLMVRVSVGNLSVEGRHQFLVIKPITPDSGSHFDRNGFFHISPDLICIADNSGFLRQVNPVFVRTLGWSERELISQPLLGFVHPDDVEKSRQEIRKLEDGVGVQCFRNRCQCKNGNYLWLEWKARVAERGKVFATARDVTEQVETLEKLKTQNDQLARELRLKEFAIKAKNTG